LTRLRFLLDENMPHAVRDQLLLRKPEMQVHAVGDVGAPALGTPDPEILIWLEANDAVLVSRNRRTMPVHLRNHLAEGRHVPGVLLIRRHYTWGQVMDDLQLVWDASSSDEYRDRIEYLPL
jgi:hypothetical protein